MSQHLEKLHRELEEPQVTKRSEAIVGLSDHLSHTSIYDLHNYKEYENLLQALVSTTQGARNAYLKNESTASQQRLLNAVKTLKLFVEKYQAVLSKNQVNAVIDHSMSDMLVDGRLMDSFSKEYVDILRSLWTFNPKVGGGGHLDRLNGGRWCRVMGICWGGVFGRTDIGREEGLTVVDEEWLNFYDLSSSEFSGSLTKAPKSKKRVVQGSDEDMGGISPPPLPTKTQRGTPLFPQSGTQGAKNHKISPLVISLVSLISLLMTARLAQTVLNRRALASRFIQFFHTFPKETSAHIHAMTAFNRLLADTTTTDRQLSSILSRKLYSSLVQLWSTKNMAFKEHLIIALKYLWPFLVVPSKFISIGHPFDSVMNSKNSQVFGDFDEDSVNDESRCKELLDAIFTDPTLPHCRIGELDLDTLRLGMIDYKVDAYLGKRKGRMSQNHVHSLFESETVRFGNGFTKENAVTWAVMELGSDCLMKIVEMQSENRRKHSLPSHSKRLRVESHIERLLEDITSTAPERAVNRLQLLLFLIERHWTSSYFPDELKVRITRLLLGSLSTNSNLSSQPWVLICLASIINGGPPDFDLLSSTPPSNWNLDNHYHTGITEGCHWIHLWHFCIKKLSDPSLSRFAANVCNFVIFNSTLIPDSEIHSSIEQFVTELQIQSPTHPFDTVCLFLCCCMAYASKNVNVYKLHCHRKFLNWLLNVWQRQRSSRFSSTYFEPQSLLRLLLHLSEFSRILIPLNICAKPEGSFVSYLEEISSSKILRDYLVEAKLPEFEVVEKEDIDLYNISSHSTTQPTNDVQHAISDNLRRMLDDYCGDGPDMSQIDMTEWSIEKLDRVVNFIVLALFYQAELSLNGVQTNSVVVSNCQNLLAAISTAIQSLQHQMPGRRQEKKIYRIIERFSALFISSSTSQPSYFEGLVEPTVASGVRPELLSYSPSTRKENSVYQLHEQLWRLPGVFEAFTPLFSVFEEILMVDPAANCLSSEERFLEAEEFESPSQYLVNLVSKTEIPKETLMATTLSCYTIVHALVIRNRYNPSQIFGLVRRLSPNQILSVAGPLCNVITTGSLEATTDDADELLEVLDSQLLQPCRLALSDEVHIFALDYLTAIMPLWAEPDREPFSSLMEKVTELIGYYIKKTFLVESSNWRIRMKFAILLQRYLETDPHARLENNTSKESGVYISHLIAMARDADFRVAFRVASSIGRVQTQWYLHRTQNDCERLGIMVAESFQTSSENPEEKLVHLLILSNLLISSTVKRPACYNLILKIPSNSWAYTPYAHAVLWGISKRLGLHDLTDLHSQFIRELSRSFYADHRPPIILLGYHSEKDFVDAILPYYGAVCYRKGDKNEITRMGNILEIPDHEVLQRCSAQVMSTLFLETFKTSKKIDVDKLRQDASDTFLKINKSDVHRPSWPTAEILKTILANFYESDCSREGPLCQDGGYLDDFGLESQMLDQKTKNWNPKRLMKQLLRWVDLQDIFISGDCIYDPDAVCRCLKWFMSEMSAPIPNVKQKDRFPGILYDIFHDLLTQVASHPFPHEQLRGLSHIGLAFATAGSWATDVAILVQLLRGFVDLLKESTLFTFVGSLFQTVFAFLIKKCVSQLSSLEQGFSLSDCLVRAATISRQMSIKVPDLKEAAEQFETELKRRLNNLIKSSSQYLQTHAKATIALLPHLVDEDYVPGLDILQMILQSMKWSCQFQGIVSAISKYKRSGMAPDEEIATLVWKLLVNLKDEDIDITGSMMLADLIFSLNGTIRWPHLGDRLLNLHDSSITKPHKKIILDHQFLKKKIVERIASSLNSFNLKLAKQTIPVLKQLFHLCQTEIMSPEQLPEYKFLVNDKSRPILLTPKHLNIKLSFLESNKDEWVKSSRDHRQWIIKLSSFLADVCAESTSESFYAQLTPVLQDVELASDILPFLTANLLLHQDSEAKRLLSVYFRDIVDNTQSSPLSIRAVIDLVIHLRNYSQPNDDAPVFNFWLDIDYLILAQGASRCQDYAAALFFLELGSELDDLFKSDTRRRDAEEVFFEIYGHLDEPDGLYGIRSSEVLQTLQRSYLHEGHNLAALELFGACMEITNSKTSQFHNQTAGRVVNALSASGLSQLARIYLDVAAVRDSETKNPVSTSTMYALARRTQKWDLPVNEALESVPQVALYSAMKSLHRDRDMNVSRNVAMACLRRCVTTLSSLSATNPIPDHGALGALLCLRDLLIFTNPTSNQEVAERFPAIGTSFPFPIAEEILSNRNSILEAYRKRELRNLIGDDDCETTQMYIDVQIQSLVKRSQLARGGDDTQSAWNAMVQAVQLSSMSTTRQLSDDNLVEFAEVLWIRGETALALEKLKEAKETAFTLARRGHWNAEARMLSRKDLCENFFEPAVQKLEHKETGGKVYYQYACFADAQFQAISKSPELLRLQEYGRRIKASQVLPDSQTRRAAGSKDISLVSKAHKVQSNDKKRLTTLQDEMKMFRITAIQMFAAALMRCNDFDDCIYRFCSLWLESWLNEDLQKNIANLFGDSGPPSYKFAVLSPQLAGRLSQGLNTYGPHFRSNLLSLLERLLLEHPFHAFYDIHLLDRRGQEDLRSSDSQKQAEELLLKAKKKRPGQLRDLSNVLTFYDALCAPDNKVKKSRGDNVIAPNLLDLVRNSKVPVPTAHLSFDFTLEYGPSQAPLIKHYEPDFKIAGGNSRPKIITCIDIRGMKHRELAKYGENEDLRQDAVMEQVFDLVNLLLAKDHQTRKRALGFRTYKVIPLSSTQGVIQFLGNMMAFGDWVTEAHKRYSTSRSKDVVSGARNDLKEAKHSKIEVFEGILKKFKPVFRHFFFESQRLPSAWFEMRLNYSRSLAVTSMVGYLVGLGDRHTSNTLIDTVKGEVVQIDLGIAFETGKYLPVPETVPFRLTREIVDGLGMTGVEGVFRRCAQETLRVLRDRSPVLMTILDVFKYDPLQRWRANRRKLREAQGLNEADEGDWQGAPDDGDRAIAIVHEKLTTSLSVEYTVNNLIQEAMSAKNLSEMYYGWQPYL